MKMEIKFISETKAENDLKFKGYYSYNSKSIDENIFD